jgi:hypothetical protein
MRQTEIGQNRCASNDSHAAASMESPQYCLNRGRQTVKKELSNYLIFSRLAYKIEWS